MTSVWLGHLVNFNQSPEERRQKYALCKLLGDNASHARRRMDWRWNKIARVHGYSDFANMNKVLGGEITVNN